jgi:hypothetical protein
MITRNYTDEEGKSRFADLPLPCVREGGRERTPVQRATGIRTSRRHASHGWRSAKRRSRG